MKTKSLIAAGVLLVALGGIGVVATAREQVIEKSGTVQQILMNPEGAADGLLMTDGTQVHFPPHLSAELRKAVAVNDRIVVKGVSESKILRAQRIENTQTKASVVDIPPHKLIGRPVPPAAGPRPLGPESRPALTQLKIDGKITQQLFGPRGDVNGVILEDGSIVHFGPRALDRSKVKLSPGENLQANGYGTKNEFGQSIEATDLKNN